MQFRISDFGLKQLKSDQIPFKIPQSAIPNLHSKYSNTPEVYYSPYSGYNTKLYPSCPGFFTVEPTGGFGRFRV